MGLLGQLRWLIGALMLAGLHGCGSPESVPTGAEAPVDAPAEVAARYLGADVCKECHAGEYAAWQGSHHDLAMQKPDPRSVLATVGGPPFTDSEQPTTLTAEDGLYLISTDNADGALQTFEIAYTFGVEPLQQYLLPLSGGRLQALGVAWDARPVSSGGQRWMHLHAGETITHDDVLHWTAGGANWNHMCADCHSTAVQKNYDATTRTFATTYAEIDVACEACHGPGSRHVEAARSPSGSGAIAGLADQAEQINSCAPCHSRRSQLAEGFDPATHYLDHYRPALLSEGLYHSDGQILDEVYVYGSFLQSRMHAAGVACSDCHDPHTARLKLTGNAVCTQCHSPAGRVEFPTLPKGVYDDVTHHFHAPDSEGAACVSCHMPTRTYMQVDARRDHSFRLPRPDMSVRTGVPNACNACHRESSAEWAAAEIAERFGERRKPHFGDVLHAARRGMLAAEGDLTALAEDAGQAAIVRATALSLMVAYERAGSGSAIRKALRDDDPIVVLGALSASERWTPDVRWQRLAHLLDAPRKAVRIEAARLLVPALGQLRDDHDRRRLQGGIDEYMQTMRLNADRPEAQLSMAAVHAQLGDPAAADAALQESLRLNPQFVPALLNLADLYRATGRDSDGAPLLERAREILPDSPDVLIAQGFWLVRQQRHGAAVELFEQAYRIEPDTVRPAYVYAIALDSLGETARAREVVSEALRRNPGNRQLTEMLAGFDERR